MLKTQWILTCVPLYTILGLILGASISAGIFVFHVAVVPLIFKYSKTFRRSLIFANFVQWPLSIDFNDPSSSGIDGARNFYLEYQSKTNSCPVRLGIWHILPKTTYERMKGSFEGDDDEQLNELMDEELTNSKTPVILYCHGNSNSRAAWHRIQLYKFFQQMDFHTIAFDYRGYGDSTNLNPSEGGVVEDSLIVYDWLVTTLDKSEAKPPIYVWGHSLGIKFNICFCYHAFVSDVHLSRATSLPVLVLHAKDDVIVPYVVGHKLYKSILESRRAGDAAVTLHAYDSKLNLGHKWICTAPDLPRVVRNFVETHR
ncbi:PREDICTED: monoacylglycerol lipase ABHD12-like [Papilio polytes]|uniref:monoacylglycerol lipase ABHD12-like n=1 Tax=Papilio polytes TaxID=76194 RepID=UPI0006761429|nr:PREDICTED: monoacylglycerol lipase ABHD12-like [Papilio polytes]